MYSESTKSPKIAFMKSYGLAFKLKRIPILTTVSPKKRIMRQISQPNPVLSGQLTVITLGSPSCSECLIITTSSYNMPISPMYLFRLFFFKFLSKRLNLCLYANKKQFGLALHFQVSTTKWNFVPVYPEISFSKSFLAVSIHLSTGLKVNC